MCHPRGQNSPLDAMADVLDIRCGICGYTSNAPLEHSYSTSLFYWSCSLGPIEGSSPAVPNLTYIKGY
jgi:hypothetical protein